MRRFVLLQSLAGLLVFGGGLANAVVAPPAGDSPQRIEQKRDALHGGFTVIGDTSLKLFTVHVVDKGKPLYDDAR
jgi:hypothetical protein